MAIQRRSSIAGLVLTAVALMACSDSSTTETDGQTLFEKNCKLCHGKDGKKMLAGAPDLSVSNMTKEQRMEIITNGKGTMTPFKDRFSPEQVEAVADYLEKLKQ